MAHRIGTAAVAAMVVALSGAAAAEEVVVGAAVALSGFITPYDDGPVKAMQLAIDDLNAKGGLLGSTIRLVTADTKSDPALGANAAIEVLEQGAQMVMVTCDFDYGAPAALMAQSRSVVAFSSCAADPKFGAQGIGPFAYTLSLATPAQGALLAEWAYQEKGFRRPYVLEDTMVEYTKSLCRAFQTRWTELAGADSIAGHDTFHGVNDASIANQITRLRAVEPAPDFVMFCGAINGGSAIRQIRAAGIETPLVASESMDGAYWLESVPDLSEFYVAVYGSTFGNDPDPAVAELMTRFAEKYGTPPVTGHSLTGYAVVQAWAWAVEKAGTFDGEAVRAALDTMTDAPLVVGPTSYTPDLHINTKRPMLLMQVTGGKHAPLGRFSAEQVPPFAF